MYRTSCMISTYRVDAMTSSLASSVKRGGMDYDRSDAKDAAREAFHGVWAAMTTPFTETGELDEAGLRWNMRYVTEQLRVDGVFCTGVMGEFWSFTREEWMQAIKLLSRKPATVAT